MKCVVFSILVWIAICGTPVWGWEADFHYGLTKWLSIQAGFPKNKAEIIAQGTISYDHGFNSAVHQVFVYACLFNDDLASNYVRKAHFPSSIRPPAHPNNRKVEPGSAEARRAALKEIAPTGDVGRDSDLFDFGETLHPLQDSWSHQGVPGSPLWCNKHLSWGHPDDRGGWLNHDADLTYLWPADAIRAAEVTYEFLQDYLNQRDSSTSGKAWDLIKGDVEEFVKADTKSLKKTWFNEHGFQNFAFLEETCLEDGDFEYEDMFSHFTPPQGLSKFDKQVEGHARVKQVKISKDEEVNSFFEQFLTDFVTETDYEKTFKQSADPIAISTGLPRKEDKDISVPPEDVRRRLEIWRLRDHGLANSLGHGEENVQLATLVSAEKEGSELPGEKIKYDTLEDALLPFSDYNEPFLIFRLPKDKDRDLIRTAQRYAAMVRLKNAPHDILIFVASRSPYEYKIVDVMWTLDH